MNYLPIELVQEIGLYLDPKSYYRLRNSFQTILPLQQRILPCYFDHPNVTRLLSRVIENHTLDDVIKLTEVDNWTEIDKYCIRMLVKVGFWDVLVPFEQKVLEIVPNFYRQDNLENAIKRHQNVYVKALFSHTQIATIELSALYSTSLHRHLDSCQLTFIPTEILQISSLTRLYHHDLHRHLQKNQLSSIPPEIGLLSRLKWLYHHD
jgi:hypothetical protein